MCIYDRDNPVLASTDAVVDLCFPTNMPKFDSVLIYLKGLGSEEAAGV